MTPTRRHWSRKHGVWVAHSFVLVLLRSCTVPEDQVQRTKIFSSELCVPPASTRRAGGGGRSRRRAAYAVDD
ncbi:unnamed protein product [Sphagnum jensenii]